MGRPRVFTEHRVTTTFQGPLELLDQLSRRAAEMKLTSRNELIRKALEAYLAGEESEGALRARLEEGYCEAHNIALVRGDVLTLLPQKKLSTEEEEIHRKTLNFIGSIYLGG